MNQQEIAKKLEERLLTGATTHAADIRAFYQKQYETDRRNYIEVLQGEIQVYMDKELKELQEENAMLNAKANMELRRELFGLRNELVDGLFEKVRVQLREFVNSPAYADYIKRQIEVLREAEVDLDGMFVIRKEDEALFASVVGKAQTEVSEQIGIGGFVYRDKAQLREYDETLETALQSQQEWFEQSSHLVL